jgi:predicted membrane metal-binding protein
LLGRLSLPVDQRNPGGFNYRAYLTLNNIYGIIYVFGVENVSLLSSHRGSRVQEGIILPIKNYTTGIVDSMIGGDEGSL